MAFLFPSGDAQMRRLRQLAIPIVVVRSERLFQPEDVVVRERARALNRRLGVPHQSGVDQQVDIIPEPFARLADERDVGLLVLPHGFPPELDGGETSIAEALRPLARLVRRRPKQSAGVGTDLLVEPPPKQLPHRLPERLSLDIPQRDVDSAHRMQTDAAASAVDVLAVHLVPEVLRFEGVFADDQVAQPRRHVVRERPFDRALDRQRSGVNFADTGDPGVG